MADREPCRQIQLVLFKELQDDESERADKQFICNLANVHSDGGTNGDTEAVESRRCKESCTAAVT